MRWYGGGDVFTVGGGTRAACLLLPDEAENTFRFCIVPHCSYRVLSMFGEIDSIKS
jgi:hypothetical protein